MLRASALLGLFQIVERVGQGLKQRVGLQEREIGVVWGAVPKSLEGFECCGELVHGWGGGADERTLAVADSIGLQNPLKVAIRNKSESRTDDR
jgi:hypothetical protein